MQEAINKAGGPTSLAALIDPEKLKKAHINGWRVRNRPPVEYAADVERLTGVSRKRLFPKTWHRIWPELIPAKEGK